MSTIERAMNRLRGTAVPAELPASTPHRPEPVAEAEPVVPNVVRPGASAQSGGVQTRSGQDPGPIGGVAPFLAAPEDWSAQQDAAGSGANRVDLDFALLSSRGYMVPGEQNVHMAEEYQQIKRRLLANMVDGMMPAGAPSNLVMVTSSVPGEGKTFTSLNLAISMAMEMERTVLVVDTDILKCDLSKLVGAYGRPGLFDVLSRGDLELSDVLLRTNVPKLTVLPAGTIRQQASEKLASEAMRRLTHELATRYRDRIVLFDCPPILANSGATALAPAVGQTVMVVEAARTTRETVQHALLMMDPNPITGLILNKTREARAGGHYYNYYGYQQGQSRTG